ncbi:UDP-glucose/GDP-mannose dehydrogenase family, NAD binding domain protein [Acididesulfobacillus acetoxydans]|uniref:UDP-N-acetyl-D-glucosamine 6-dehydrogenase n=1 Tax=Acididesulfobacillus acetoxydans TaxID=1561005 RepID=A0A8S0XUQ6_9FIRM|nr:nucleotide sugar dehydrogenase [Acididesulfobacillus acetoxydans]CAA7599637.1 UDP-glucose/GDP-mannose dehydrogenase family, NAD binding domain protein [Acididesulfobacillus acetoxydans]CEJ06189.1 UDP-N-acetyl-D-glucosamine 6-dehydrogenase [Acididesulfobacillus acetoxydans]
MITVQQVITDRDTLAQALKDKIERHTARIGVIGLGYVGLPLAVEKGKVGFPVIGFDINSKRVDKVNAGENYIGDVKDIELGDLVQRGVLKATADFALLAECDVIIICVPTPLTITRDPDISYIEASTRAIAKYLRPGQLVTLESTTYPGTTQEIILPLLAESGLEVGKDFFLAFSPERVDPGNKRFSTKNTSKVVGGVTPVCLEIAYTLYAQTIVNVVPVSSPAAAELTKVFENTYRAVNIALVNELMLLCDRMGLDIWEVVEAAGTKPFGIQTFYPGPGVGGHCIPIDPFYLTWKAREYDFHTRFIELAGEINVEVSYYVVNRVIRALNSENKSLKDAKVFVLGVAYKKDIDDVRESPALKIMELLRREGATVSYHDPFIPVIEPHGGSTVRLESTPLSDAALAEADCVLILTDHSSVDYERVVEQARVVVDTRNATKNVKKNREKIAKI